MTHLDALKIYSCEKHCKKRRKHGKKRRSCLLQTISPFFTMFSTLYGTYFSFSMHSAICLNLDQSKVLSSGNRLIPTLFTFGSYCYFKEKTFTLLKSLSHATLMCMTYLALFEHVFTNPL